MIKYLGAKKGSDGLTIHSFIINGAQREIPEAALKKYPGCAQALSSAAKQKIAADKAWLSKAGSAGSLPPAEG